MARVSYGGNGIAAASMYTAMSDELSDYVGEMNSRALGAIDGIARRFYDRARDFASRVDFSQILNSKSRADRAMKSIYLDDDIRHLDDLIGFVTAKPRMRRYLMADPELNQMARDNKLSLWEGEFKVETEWKPEENPYYLHAINHTYREDSHVSYREEMITCLEDMEELTLEDKIDIELTWASAKRIIQMDKLDPTSPWGSTLD